MDKIRMRKSKKSKNLKKINKMSTSVKINLNRNYFNSQNPHKTPRRIREWKLKGNKKEKARIIYSIKANKDIFTNTTNITAKAYYTCPRDKLSIISKNFTKPWISPNGCNLIRLSGWHMKYRPFMQTKPNLWNSLRKPTWIMRIIIKEWISSLFVRQSRRWYSSYLRFRGRNCKAGFAL